MIQTETLDLAKCLLTYESEAGRISVPTEPAAFRVYEKLRRPLCELAGVAGFQSLVSRALTLAKAEAPVLNTVQVTREGSLQGLGEIELQMDNNHAGEGGVILIAQLLGLLDTFIGKALTLRLVQDVWPNAAVKTFQSGTGENHEPPR